ncbi:hypothetical protein ACJMK2_043870 [Sinanodonta woodiana]|uniref:Peptidase A2 domain-containing protein n=1 Tax=Sinanodonta woodiana TaxID=1069815 RepID=A0ABD3VZZ9_SINWO
MFMTDSGSDLTLITYLVCESCWLEGHNVVMHSSWSVIYRTLVCGTYQHFPLSAQVDLVINLAAAVLMKMNKFSKEGSSVITRSMAKGIDEEMTVDNND